MALSFTDQQGFTGGGSNPELQNNTVIQSIRNTHVVATKSLCGHYPTMPKMSAM